MAEPAVEGAVLAMLDGTVDGVLDATLGVVPAVLATGETELAEGSGVLVTVDPAGSGADAEATALGLTLATGPGVL